MSAQPRPAALVAGDRVLVTRLDYLGDVVLSLPLVDAIRREIPGVVVDYLARRPGADLLEGDDRFERVFALDRNDGVAASARLVTALRRRRYRAVVDLYSNPRSAWLSWLTGAPTRVGSDRRGRRHLYTHALRVKPSVRSATAHHLAFGAPLGVHGEGGPGKPSIVARESERTEARRILAGAGVEPGARVVGIHPGGKWSVKRWPTGSFAALVRAARERLGAAVVVFTGPGEPEHTEALRAVVGDGVGYLDVLPIRTVAAVLSELDAMVACDGGVMHVSVAVGTPTVGVFGSSEPEIWFPYEGLGPYRAAYLPLECRPCHRHECPLGHTRCLNALEPEQVFRALAGAMEA